MSNRYPVVFDGHELTKFFSVRWGVERPLPEWTPNLVTVPGRAGAILAGTRAEPTTVSMELAYIDKSRTRRQEAARTLASWLAVDEAKPLVLGDEGGLYRMAVPSGSTQVDEYYNAEVIHLTFTCPDPILYGGEHSAVVPSGGSLDLKVGGTAPTWPVIYAPMAVKDSSIGCWRLTLDGIEQFDVPIAATTVTPVRADCERRVLTVGNTLTVLTPSCAWMRLTPGEHTITMTGAGNATITWRDRWW